MNYGVYRVGAWVPRVFHRTSSLQRPVYMAAAVLKQQVGRLSVISLATLKNTSR